MLQQIILGFLVLIVVVIRNVFIDMHTKSVSNFLFLTENNVKLF